MTGIMSSVPETLTMAVNRYEKALADNDKNTLSELFAVDPDGLPVTRADNAGLISGHENISEYRSRRRDIPRRTLRSRMHRMISDDAAIVISLFDKSTGGVVVQTQVWQRISGAWRIESAHLIYPAPALDSRIWRIAGTPLVRGSRDADKMLPLQGCTVAVKDLYGVKGYAIGAGNAMYLAEGMPQEQNSAPVQRLLDAGADILGIARTDEFAYSIAGTNSHYGTPPNCQAPDRISGGSSSGSASAVAMGQSDIGLGSDTGGSIRVPAAYQHLWGIRTTHGLVPMRGVLPLAQSFDTVGWMAREVASLKRVAEVVVPRSACDAAELSGCICWPDEILSGTTSDVSRAISTWIAHLALAIRGKSDLSLHSVALDACLGPRMRGEGRDRLSDWLATYRVIQAFEAWRNHGNWIASHWGTLGEDVRSRFKMAQNTTEKEYEAACGRMAYWRSNVREVLQRNVLLVPSASGVAPKISDSQIGSRIIDQVRTSTMRLACIAGLSGLPAVNIPLRTEDGLPCGLSVIGPAGSDIKLISFARELSALVK